MVQCESKMEQVHIYKRDVYYLDFIKKINWHQMICGIVNYHLMSKLSNRTVAATEQRI